MLNIDNTLQERGDRYGPFNNHARIAIAFKEQQRKFSKERGQELLAHQQEALDMIFHKIARIINGDPNYADSWVDIAGYAKLVADDLEEEAE